MHTDYDIICLENCCVEDKIMRIAVCDDDERAVSRIGKLIAEYQISRDQSIDCHYFTNSIDFLCDMRGGEYDLVLLDVLMPDASGIQAAQELRKLDRNVRIIFVSTSPEFAVESYNVGAYHYLLKPVDTASLFTLLDKIGSELSAQAEQGFVLRSRDGMVQIAFARLAYVEVINKTLFFHLADGTVHGTTAALADFEEKLLARREFVKTHRSYLVNLSYIQAIDINSIVMKNGHSIPLSRQRRSLVQDTYMHFQNQTMTQNSATADKPRRNDGPWQILLVDDEPAQRAVWADILQNHGCIVYMADNGKEALRMIADHWMVANHPYDCVLLDVMIPDENGFAICERMHRFMDTPIIFLSCLTETEQQIAGFAAGGIDYITKDTPAELFWAKVESHIRLAMSERTQLRYGPLLVDLTNRRVLIDDREVSLTPIEFDILCRLAERTGHIFTPEEIYSMIWGDQPWDGGHLVQMHMSRLRRKLEKAWESHRFIETVWGQGYRFVPAKQSF